MEVKLELQNNILKFGYGINYKYKGMLAHSFDRFYVITKFVLPTLDYLKLHPINYDKNCQYLWNLDDENDDRIKQNIKDLLFYCSKLKLYMSFYNMQITAHNLTDQKIVKNEVDLILPNFQMEQRNKRAIFGTIISRFLGLAFEGISSFLHQKRHKALQRAVKLMSITTYAQRNKLMHLENLLIMYGVYDVETLSELVQMARVLHSWQMLVEQIFTGQQVWAYEIYTKMQDAHGVQYYITNSLLYLQTIKENYIVVYNGFLTQLRIYA